MIDTKDQEITSNAVSDQIGVANLNVEGNRRQGNGASFQVTRKREKLKVEPETKRECLAMNQTKRNGPRHAYNRLYWVDWQNGSQKVRIRRTFRLAPPCFYCNFECCVNCFLVSP